jgi:succinyl-CoA synthetase beta subunit
MDIEEVAEHTPHLIFTEEIDPSWTRFSSKKNAFNLGLSGNAFKEMVKFIDLYTMHTLDLMHQCLKSTRFKKHLIIKLWL